MSDVLSDGGERLRSFLDGLPVETNWVAGFPVVWQTGQINGAPETWPGGHTHCSAFAAAVALDLDLYLLRPPNHVQLFLSNAQMDWLSGDDDLPGPSAMVAGWQDLGESGEVSALINAVAAANLGKLVIGGYRQPLVDDPKTGELVEKPGHIVIVRPQNTFFDSQFGPLVTMAGDTNWRSIYMSRAFASHPQAWPSAVHLFSVDTDLE